MDRIIVYPGSVPLDTDILNVQRNTMKALGMLAQATLGTGTVADGLALSPTSPATMTVNVGAGSILSQQVVDANAFGSLPSDSSTLMKMGIITTASQLTLTAPSTSGQTTTYVIQAAFNETAGNAVVFPYYNPTNPAVGYSGPSNSGAAQNSQVTQGVTLSLVSSTAATSSTPALPTLTSGCVGLWVVNVAYGQTSVTSANWYLYPNAPFIQTKIPQARIRFSSAKTIYVSTAGSDSTGIGGLVQNTPFATPQGAYSWLQQNVDTGGQTVTIQIAAGNYGSVYISETLTGQGTASQLRFVGAGSTTVLGYSSPSAAAFQADQGALCTLTSVSVQNAQYVNGTFTNAGYGILATNSSIIILNNITLLYCGIAQICSSTHSLITVNGSGATFSVTGTSGSNGLYLGLCQYGSYLSLIGATVTFTNAITYTTTFLAADQSEMDLFSMTFTNANSVTASRFSVASFSIINTNGGGLTYLPGNSAGNQTATGFNSTSAGFYA